MNSRLAIVLSCLLPFAISASPIARAPAAPAPAAGEYARHFAALQQLSVAVAQSMPTDDYSFRPHPECGFHAFRHLHASLLLSSGAAPQVAQKQLRHSDARITLGIYGHVIGDSQREAVEKVASILFPTVPNSELVTEVIQ